MKNFVQKRNAGTVSVFLLLILTTMFLCVGIVIEVSAGMTARSVGDAAFRLTGQSILSEYSRDLNEQYGLFALTNDERSVYRRAEQYLKTSMRKSKDSLDVLQLKPGYLSLDFSGYAMTDPELLEQQILRCMKYRSAELLKEYVVSERTKADVMSDETKETLRTLRNRGVIEGLPSIAFRIKGIELPDLDELPDPGHLLSDGKDSLLLNQYILSFFGNRNEKSTSRETFFRGEVEYILCGKMSDRGNLDEVKAMLLALRTGINCAHIRSSPEKTAEVQAVALALTPGPEAVVTQAALTLAWAAAEAANDVARLERGGCVPLMKTDADWMFSLEGVLENLFEGKTLEPTESSGLNYKEYLLLFLFFEDREAKLIRIMDLIQINMKGNYDSGFSMANCYGGVEIEGEIVREKSFFHLTGTRTGKFKMNFMYDEEDAKP